MAHPHSRASRALCVLAMLAALVAPAVGHGAMTFPRSRNSVDGAIAPWTQWAYPCDATHKGVDCQISFCENGKNCQGSCPISAHSGAKNALNASNGQACYWFSNGCTIGCDKCDGTQNHVGHGMQKFLYKGKSALALNATNETIPNPFNPPVGDMVLNRSTTKGLAIKANCANPLNATICARSLRTANTQAECGSADDYYFYSPWRRPGSAPVIDSCGSAGGRFPGQGTGGAGAQFQNTSLAREGDLGSKLPAMPPQATWSAGSSVEVGWTVQANHGGGYSYRLAPADGPLNEETFGKMALDFDGESALRWDGDRASQQNFQPADLGWEVNEGTVPAGSMWRKNPIPSGLWEREGPQFQPVCQESEACIRAYTFTIPNRPIREGICRCSGYSNGGPLLPNLEVVDRVKIPSGLKAGHYVLQFRWDCEETDQIWTSCADVAIE